MTPFLTAVQEIAAPRAQRVCACGEVNTSPERPVCGVCWACASWDMKNQFQFGNKKLGLQRLLNYAAMRKTLNRATPHPGPLPIAPQRGEGVKP